MNAWKKPWVKRSALAVLIIAAIPLASAVFLYVKNTVKAENIISFKEKTPLEYTLEEYEMLTPQQQDKFFQWFDSIEAFEAWMSEATNPMPWELANRNPAEYTWDEYNELTNEQQEAFIASFESAEAFESWMESVYSEDAVPMPWENENKTPVEYTWVEFEALTAAQQDAFIEWFDSPELFEQWMKDVASLDVLIAYGIVDPNTAPSAETLVDDQDRE